MFDIIVKRTTDVFKLLAVAVPTALSVSGYIYRDVIIKAVANQMYEPMYEDLKKDLPSIISDVILNDEKTSVQLDSNQMLQIKSYVVDAQNKTLMALPIMMMKYADVAKNEILTQTYPVHDFYTGKFLYNVTGVKTDGTWVILQKETK